VVGRGGGSVSVRIGGGTGSGAAVAPWFGAMGEILFIPKVGEAGCSTAGADEHDVSEMTRSTLRHKKIVCLLILIPTFILFRYLDLFLATKEYQPKILSHIPIFINETTAA